MLKFISTESLASHPCGWCARTGRRNTASCSSGAGGLVLHLLRDLERIQNARHLGDQSSLLLLGSAQVRLALLQEKIAIILAGIFLERERERERD